MKLLVRNLPRSLTEAELKAMFQTFGAVQSCTLVLDDRSGLSKGFGFVEMPKAGQRKAAMQQLNGQDIQGHRIRVKKALPPSAEASPAPAAPAPDANAPPSGQLYKRRS
jgi:RNA recognition motif-containing protein